ncbi:MAG: hypothetical protein ACD_20C00109G0031 [uncultured bacterium]|nr:MAG: hypothetical protein ACD_20C00109G0031 [uncultured bacterium]HBH17959.1 YhcH/YjgK/YiaL family protein [Cyanobacteria bacterium UBA9579]
MIIDHLKNAHLYYKLDKNIAIAFKFLEETDLFSLKSGKYEIEGDKIFAIAQDYVTKPKHIALWEAHTRYIDIQCIIKGKELIGYTNVENLKPDIDYDSDKDIQFLKGEGDFLKMSAGMFMILMPHDAHMPSISINHAAYVKKVVIKVEA